MEFNPHPIHRFDYGTPFAIMRFKRVIQNRVPIEAHSRPDINHRWMGRGGERRWVNLGDRVKIIRNKDHSCNVVDSMRGEVWYADLDISMAHRLAEFGNALGNLMEDLDKDWKRLKELYRKDREHQKRMARHGLDIEGRIGGRLISGLLDEIHAKCAAREDEASDIFRAMNRLYESLI